MKILLLDRSECTQVILKKILGNEWNHEVVIIQNLVDKVWDDFEKLCNEITLINPDLILLTHDLGGLYSKKSGADIASRFRDKFYLLGISVGSLDLAEQEKYCHKIFRSMHSISPGEDIHAIEYFSEVILECLANHHVL